MDFEKMVLGRNVYKTEKVVYNAKSKIDFMSLLPVDYVYFDPEYRHENVQTAKASCDLRVISGNADL